MYLGLSQDDHGLGVLGSTSFLRACNVSTFPRFLWIFWTRLNQSAIVMSKLEIFRPSIVCSNRVNTSQFSQTFTRQFSIMSFDEYQSYHNPSQLTYPGPSRRSIVILFRVTHHHSCPNLYPHLASSSGLVLGLQCCDQSTTLPRNQPQRLVSPLSWN